MKSKVCAVALTDSVHNVWHQEAGKSILEWMQEVRHEPAYCSSTGDTGVRFIGSLFYLLTVSSQLTNMVIQLFTVTGYSREVTHSNADGVTVDHFQV